MGHFKIHSPISWSSPPNRFSKVHKSYENKPIDAKFTHSIEVASINYQSEISNFKIVMAG